MRIKNNISALNAHIALSINQSKLTKSLEKLASGYRINRAGDDAAGLAISEQMRAMISGMKQAELNAREGIGLIRTGEGALQEVNAMFVRLNELAMQSANGTYDDEEHRTLLQEEVDQICDEINRIAESTNYNGVNLFQDIGLEAEGDDAYATGSSLIKNTLPGQGEAAAMTLEDVLADKSDTLKNIIYTETVFDFETTQTPDGVANSFSTEYQAIADTLQTSIVPQVVNAIMGKYTAFNYLNGSSIGIGLKLENNSSSSTLASVTLGTSYSTSGGVTSSDLLSYTLTVNVGKADLKTEAGRSALEQTIAHEMIHAFMDEATTAGMTGISQTGKNDNNKFPMWFIEGMAQTASGPGNWTRALPLNLNKNSSVTEIGNALSQTNTLLSNSASNTAAQYGTGYLACMYLGFKASGADLSVMSDGAQAAVKIAEGLSAILDDLVNGDSLQTAIGTATGGKYNSIVVFEQGFANDAEAQAFVKELLQYTSLVGTDGENVGGGLISGDLSTTDPVVNDPVTDLKLFALNTSYPTVNNKYPSDITVLSGGSKTVSGVKPIPDPVVYPSTGVFTVSDGIEHTDWEFDTATGTLVIKSGTAMTISGGTLKKDGTTYYGNIKIDDNINANLTLNGVNIDVSKRAGASVAGIQAGEGSKVNIVVQGTNNIRGRNDSAGIQVGGGYSDLTIDLTNGSVLNVTGGTRGAGIGAAYRTAAATSSSNIKITGEGTIVASGGEGAAAIGGSTGGRIGNIEITGTPGTLTVKATGGQHGAGIGGGWFNAYPSETPNVGNITISGNVDIDASSRYHGTGIGSGCCGEMGTLTIGTAGVNNNNIKITASGGDEGAAIGAGWAGSVGDITIHGGTIRATSGTRGAGIGSGYQAESGRITINGGTITANGSTNSSGIGSGMNGTVAGIDINGGIISADGGWTNDGGNIGGYTDKSGAGKATVTISNPGAVSIKAGEKGEGKYITTGAKDGSGNTLYALDMKYIDQLLKDGKVTLSGPGTGAASLTYPLASVKVTGASGSVSWNNLQHMQENSAYIWTKGEDITLEFVDQNGTKGSVRLKFYDDYGLWRFEDKDLPAELPKEPGYVATNPGGDTSRGGGSIILQVGAHGEDTFRIPRFYFSKNALKLDQFDVTTLEKANKSVTLAQEMTQRVSAIRGSYGAMDNALSHVINSLNVNLENQTAAESRIRDTDMAKELMEQTKNSILLQANQAMLSQANALPQSILELLR